MFMKMKVLYIYIENAIYIVFKLQPQNYIEIMSGVQSFNLLGKEETYVIIS